MHSKVPQQEIVSPIIVIIGPTAIGKTDLSIGVAQEHGCEVVSVDSMQVYRHMDIGTAKITEEEKQGIPHHLIDIVDPDEEYNVARFVEDALEAIRKINGRGCTPLLTGGTGLYLNSLKNGIFEGVPSDPEIRSKLNDRIKEEGSRVLHEELSRVDSSAAEKIHPNDTARILRALEVYLASGMSLSQHICLQKKSAQHVVFKNMLIVGLNSSRERLYNRINVRTREMLEGGLEEEVLRLFDMGYTPELKSMQSIGYRHMCNYINGDWSKIELYDILARDTRRYAKRQFTWFKKDNDTHWFERDKKTEIQQFISDWLRSVSNSRVK